MNAEANVKNMVYFVEDDEMFNVAMDYHLRDHVSCVVRQFNSGEEYCEAVAETIHSNLSSDIVTTCDYVNIAAPPPNLTGPLAYG